MGVAVGLSALGFGMGSETLLEPEELRAWSGGAVGFECGCQLLLELEHFWNRGSWEIFPVALS